MDNFIDKETSEKFFFPRVRSSYRDGKMIHTDGKGKQLVNPSNGNILSRIEIEGEIQAPAVFTDTASRYSKNVQYFKDRAEKHNKSDEVQYNNMVKERDTLFHT